MGGRGIWNRPKREEATVILAVTIGVGHPYNEMARLAARRMTRYTGLEARVLGEDTWAAVRNECGPSPTFMKVLLFDLLPDATDIVYFDADLVCLARWDPKAFSGLPRLVAVRDRWFLDCVVSDAATFGIDAQYYFNAGFFIANRAHHAAWLRRAAEIVRHGPVGLMMDQGPLNAARHELGVRVRFLDRRYNWLGFGEGPLFRRTEVIMAHAVTPSGEKDAVLEFLRSDEEHVTRGAFHVSELHFERLGNQLYWYGRLGYERRVLELRSDGTIGRGCGYWERYWFVYRSETGEPVLALGNERATACRMVESEDGTWVGRWHRFFGVPAELRPCCDEHGP